MGGAMETSVLDAVKDYDAELAQKIQDQMFTSTTPGFGRQGHPALLREVSRITIIALRYQRRAVRKIFKNMPSRAAKCLGRSGGRVRAAVRRGRAKEILRAAEARRCWPDRHRGRGGEEGMVE
jgi:flagellar motor switch protein FliG